MKTGRAFIQRADAYLRGDYLPKIRLSVESLSEEDLWWRPNPASNSIGNLILHLAGNVRQWVVSGIGGAPDERRREEEFQADGGYSGPELLAQLETALGEVGEVLEGLDPGDLLAPRTIQGIHTNVLDALFHVVEHFSTHTGQIIYLTKMRTGRDLGFWEIRDGNAIPRW